LSERVRAVAHHGIAATFGALSFALFTLATMLVMSGVRYDIGASRVYAVKLPYARFFTQPAPSNTAFERESAMSATALLDRWTPFVEEASKRFGIPPAWIRAVMRQESGGRTVTEGDRPITSPAGAQGLMQVMPDTYDDARRELGLGGDAYNPHDNVMAGASLLRSLYRRYGFPAMFAAYNDGPGNYEASLRGDHELPKETQSYLASITAHLGADPPRRRRARVGEG